MGARNLLILKTQFGSINIRLVNDFVCGNMIWAVGSLWVFFCNYVPFSFGLILRYIFRFDEFLILINEILKFLID